ncbi:MAG: bifunctional pyr operon transcriptional regulator/uracil phosphoribosyltransferase PyrR [Planctomycetota bacterium]|jgi:pyrimidine operon attenuation protein/uracil phosphoribosyltransferase
MSDQQCVRILDAAAMSRMLARLAHEILERNETLDNFALVGIRTRGVPLAERLADKLGQIAGRKPSIGMLDINLYRDDLSLTADHPVLRSTEIPFDLDGMRIVLVDDVLFTGRTIRAALDGMNDLGRPQVIQLAVMVDRGHRELPIRPDFVGKNVPTARNEEVEVRLAEIDGEDEIVLIQEGQP